MSENTHNPGPDSVSMEQVLRFYVDAGVDETIGDALALGGGPGATPTPYR